MKNIVLYTIVFLGVLLAGIPVNAQKPAIELLPTDHQHQHPEAMADTISLGESMQARQPVTDSSTYRQKSLNLYKKEDGTHKRTGWHFKVFHFKKQPDRIRRSNQRSDRTPFFKHIHPIQLFIQITALK
jgi:hypothetical protein